MASRLAGLLLVCGEPRIEVDLPDAGARARRQLAAVQLCAVVPSVRVSDDGPVLAAGREQPPRPRVDAQRLGPAQLDALADRERWWGRGALVRLFPAARGTSPAAGPPGRA